MRRLVVCFVLTVGLAGCVAGSSGRARPEMEKFGEKTRAEAVEVFEAIAQGVEANDFSGTGSGSWTGCADVVGNQLKYTTYLQIMATNVSRAQYPRIVRERARSTGWEVSSERPNGFRAKKENRYLAASFSSAGMSLTVDTDCIKVSRDLVKEMDAEAPSDLGLEPPAQRRQ